MFRFGRRNKLVNSESSAILKDNKDNSDLHDTTEKIEINIIPILDKTLICLIDEAVSKNTKDVDLMNAIDNATVGYSDLNGTIPTMLAYFYKFPETFNFITTSSRFIFKWGIFKRGIDNTFAREMHLNVNGFDSIINIIISNGDNDLAIKLIDKHGVDNLEKSILKAIFEKNYEIAKYLIVKYNFKFPKITEMCIQALVPKDDLITLEHYFISSSDTLGTILRNNHSLETLSFIKFLEVKGLVNVSKRIT